MKHLSNIELVDAADNALPRDRARHLDDCAPCRTKLDDLRVTLTRVSAVDAAEPSPLFWEHFSARVRDAVHEVDRAAAAKPAGAGLWEWRSRWSLAGAVLVLGLVAGVWRLSAPVTPYQSPGAPAAQIQVQIRATTSPRAPVAEPMDLDAIESDQAWALVRTLADDVTWDEAVTAGLGARPGVAERAMLDLTVEERQELLTLLQAETPAQTKRPGA